MAFFFKVYQLNFSPNERQVKGLGLALIVLGFHWLILTGALSRVMPIHVTSRQTIQLQLHTQESNPAKSTQVEQVATAVSALKYAPAQELKINPKTDIPSLETNSTRDPPPAADNNISHGASSEVQLSPNVPLYSTILADPAELDVQIERAGITGKGRMRWNLDQGNYELQLQADFNEIASHTRSRNKKPAIDWNSQGQAQAWGVAPQRYVSSAKGRSTQATNFQAESGYVSFSGTTQTQPWVAASQDRLSWLMQLGAVLNGSAEQRKVGSRTVLWVLGTRGEADAWEFELQSYTPEQAYLVRKPQRLYDAQVHVWLNPQRQHLPLRLQLGYWGVRDSTQIFFE